MDAILIEHKQNLTLCRGTSRAYNLYPIILTVAFSISNANETGFSLPEYVRLPLHQRRHAHTFLFFFFLCVGGKEGNASCTVVPLSTVCGTPARLALFGPMSPLDKNCRLTYPLKPFLPVGSATSHLRENYDWVWS